MLNYYLKLALKSFARAPGITALMISAIAVGIGICVATLTVYHAMSGNPIWWKNDRLYAVTMDSRPADSSNDKEAPKPEPEPQLSYRDANALFRSTAPQHKAMMYTQVMVMSGGDTHTRPRQAILRVTTPDFFSMFEVPFLYGGPWSAAADQAGEPLIVLSRAENERLFSGGNSVGRMVRLGERDFRVTGVLDRWNPAPRFYDMTGSPFLDVEGAFIPFGLTTVLEQDPAGTVSCHNDQPIKDFKAFLNAECVWLQMWVELPDSASRARMQVFLDQYWTEQHAAGRFPRPRNNRLTNVGDWLRDQGVVDNQSTVLVAMSFAFLGVCVINTVGLLLARFLNNAAITGVRRALGASRRQIFTQHLVEVALIATSGAALGLGLAAAGLAVVRAQIRIATQSLQDFGIGGGFVGLAHFDTVAILWAILLAAAATLAAGAYPAWRVGRLPPARYLKSQ